MGNNAESEDGNDKCGNNEEGDDGSTSALEAKKSATDSTGGSSGGRNEEGTSGTNEESGQNDLRKQGGSDTSNQLLRNPMSSENGSYDFLGGGTNLQGVFSSPTG